jgi:hypothetical protein
MNANSCIGLIGKAMVVGDTAGEDQGIAQLRISVETFLTNPDKCMNDAHI